MKPNPPSQLDIALHHAALGREVFPFRLSRAAGASRAEKKPLVAWKTVATTDEAQIRLWAKKWPTARFGWKLPEGSIVVDIDDAEAFAGTEHILPRTAWQQTPSGGSHHLYYLPYGTGARQTVKEIPGIDTRVGGKGWVGIYGIDSFDDDALISPEWLLGDKPLVDSNTAQKLTAEDPITSRDEILAMIGTWRRGGMDEAEILAGMLARYGDGRITESDETRPWTKQDFQQLAKEAAAWSPGEVPRHQVLSVKFHRNGVETNGINEEEGEGRESTDILARLGAQYAYDIPTDPPAPLVLGFLDNDEQTILFGMGGTGKGVIAAEWAARLTLLEESPESVLIADFEGHREEWARRLHSFGASMEHIIIVEPWAKDWTGKAGAIDRKARDLRELAEKLEHDRGRPVRVFIDSIISAVGAGDANTAQVTNAYSQALQEIARPTLSLAHITKASTDTAKYPYGSVFWHNWARATWSLQGEDQEPRILTNRKSNNRALQGHSWEIDWGWVTDDSLPASLDYKKGEGSTASRATLILSALGNKETTFELLRANTGLSKGNLSSELSRLMVKGYVEKVRQGVYRKAFTVVFKQGVSTNRLHPSPPVSTDA